MTAKRRAPTWQEREFLIRLNCFDRVLLKLLPAAQWHALLASEWTAQEYQALGQMMFVSFEMSAEGCAAEEIAQYLRRNYLPPTWAAEGLHGQA